MTRCGLKDVPKTVAKIAPLEMLILDDNKLTELNKRVFKLKNLKYLSLKNNQLTSISENISVMQTLEVLDLRGNTFKEFDIAVLKALLPKCRVLY